MDAVCGTGLGLSDLMHSLASGAFCGCGKGVSSLLVAAVASKLSVFT